MRPGLPPPALVAAIASFVLGPFLVVGTLFFGLGASNTLALDGVSPAGTGAFFLAVAIAMGLGLVGGGVGLLARQPWGWWASVLVYGFFLLFHLKLAAPILVIDWEHPRAGEAASSLGLFHGLPAVLALGVLVLLSLRGTRRAFGMAQEPYRRRRKAGELRE